MKRLFLTLMAFNVVAVLATACSAPASVTHPISKPMAVTHDERLPGVWLMYGADGDDEFSSFSSVTFIIRESEAGGLDVLYSASSSALYTNGSHQQRFWGKWKAHASMIDGRTYFSGQLLDMHYYIQREGQEAETNELDDLTPTPEPVYQLAWAEITNEGNLVLHVMHENDLEGRGFPIRGKEIDPTDPEEGPFDVSSEQLVDLIRNAGPGELFTAQLGPFLRVKGGNLPDQKHDFSIFMR